mgnify:CR=1 FL=1
MTRKKGVSIGAAMKQRMGNQNEPERVIDEPVVQEKVKTPAVQSAPVITTEADPLESFNTRLPRSLQRRLKIHVAIHNTKIQDVLHLALDEYLKKQGQ